MGGKSDCIYFFSHFKAATTLPFPHPKSMPIERYKDPIPMGDSAPPEETEAVEETATLPLSILAGQEVAAGDRLTLEVVEMGEGGVTVRYPKPDKKPKALGAEALAAAFD